MYIVYMYMHVYLRVVCEVKSLWELEVQLYSGTLVWPL